MDINQISINMKTTKLFQSVLLFSLLLCSLAACSDDDDLRLSPIQETYMEGDASTLQIDMTRSDWRIASITSLEGVTMVDKNNRPLQLEGLGSLQFQWFGLTRESETQLILKADDNFDKKERGFILNLEMKTGFYKEQVTIRQKPCTNFFQVESIVYTLEEGDGVEETESRDWGVVIQDYTTSDPDVVKTCVWPFWNAYVFYSFQTEGEESPLKYVNPEEDIHVIVPKELSDGNIVYETKEWKYSTYRTEQDSELKEKEFEVDQVKGKSNEYAADLYYKKMQMSYTLTLARTNSDDKKVFKGKFSKEYPYDCSPIRCTLGELPKD